LEIQRGNRATNPEHEKVVAVMAEERDEPPEDHDDADDVAEIPDEVRDHLRRLYEVPADFLAKIKARFTDRNK
jgi:hypothetical protein